LILVFFKSDVRLADATFPFPGCVAPSTSANDCPRKCGPSFAIEATIAGGDDLTTARALYRRAVASNPDRVILLADRARILARSDRPDTMPG
jgi:hypothetical protein